MLCRHNSDPHHGGNHRNAEFLRKFPKFFTGPAQGNPAACINQRPFCFFQLPHYFLYLDNMPFYSGLIGPHIHFFRITEFVYHSVLYINGNINENRALSSRICHIKSFFEYPGDIIHVSYEVAVFHKGLCRSGDIGFLKHIASEKLAVHLAGYADKWNAVGKSCGNTGNEVCGAGA